MKIKILGCGASFGSPLAYGRNGNIDINNIRNFRTRSSILINVDNNIGEYNTVIFGFGLKFR